MPIVITIGIAIVLAVVPGPLDWWVGLGEQKLNARPTPTLDRHLTPTPDCRTLSDEPDPEGRSVWERTSDRDACFEAQEWRNANRDDDDYPDPEFEDDDDVPWR